MKEIRLQMLKKRVSFMEVINGIAEPGWIKWGALIKTMESLLLLEMAQLLKFKHYYTDHWSGLVLYLKRASLSKVVFTLAKNLSNLKIGLKSSCLILRVCFMYRWIQPILL
eukprot:NODE_37_length_35953_cov_1.028037.p15 type:complete len:111 gc:universal NODE_37_length_35953_cov_1.028037:8724-9056(+)